MAPTMPRRTSSNPAIRETASRDTPSPPSVARDMPPPRRSRALQPVALPLQNTSLRKLIYIIVILMTALSAFYAYRIVQHKSAVGGWWNLALGRHGPQPSGAPMYSSGSGMGRNIEDKITDLAKAFGMPPNELASAIAVAVRNYVPPASLSSIAAKETGNVVQVLLKGDEEIERNLYPSGEPEPTATLGVVEGVLEGVGSFVGMDEP